LTAGRTLDLNILCLCFIIIFRAIQHSFLDAKALVQSQGCPSAVCGAVRHSWLLLSHTNYTRLFITVHATAVTTSRFGSMWCHHQGVQKQLLLVHKELTAVCRMSCHEGNRATFARQTATPIMTDGAVIRRRCVED
jgi:hypothetical protein